MDVPFAWVQQLETLLMILVRVWGLVVVAPIFGGANVPQLAKAGIAFFIAGLLAGPLQGVVAPATTGTAFAEPWRYVLTLAAEFFVGAALGFIVVLVFAAFQIAGHLMDVPLGFGMVNVLDPQTGQEVPVVGQFKFALALLVFFAVNAHHAVLLALVDSYRDLPPGVPLLTGSQLSLIVTAFAEVFALGLRLALPIVGASFLINVALAVVARAVPQINVLITGFPLQILTGMFLLVFIMPAYVGLVAFVFGDNGEMVRWLWSFLSGS